MPARMLGSVLVIAVAATTLAAAPAVAVAPEAVGQSLSAAPKKKTTKKKSKSKGRKAPAKKKPAVLTATVNATVTIKAGSEYGFGNDNGPWYQQLKLEIKDAKLPFKGDYRESAGSPEVKVTWTYEAKASTDDRSWHLGCDSELRETTGTWTGKVGVGIRKSLWRQTAGKSKRQPGWEVIARQPEGGLPLTSSGWWQDWESIAMQNCITTPTTEQLGSFSAAFADANAIGSLNDDRASVLLVHTDTRQYETATTQGTIKFSDKVPN